MTTLSTRPSPINRYSRTNKVAITTDNTSPPTSFPPSSAGRGIRSDSPLPSPMMLQPRTPQYGRVAKEGSFSDPEEDFPPSISQRRAPARSSTKNKEAKDRGTSGKLLLPIDSTNTVKEKRSFERTRKWAQEAEDLRIVRMGGQTRYQMDESSVEGSADDHSMDGSSASHIPPRTPSPNPSPRDPPRLSLNLPSETHAPILSIDEIIRLHGASVQGVFTAATDRARKEMGLGPAPASPRAISNTPSTDKSPAPPTPKATLSRDGSNKSTSPPVIPSRTSSSPTALVRIVPSRSSSIGSPVISIDKPLDRASSPLPTASVRSTSTPRPAGRSSIYPTSPQANPQQSQRSLSHTPSDISQNTHPSTSTGDTATSANRNRTGKVRSSTAPAPINSAQLHEMALHLRSESLNKFLTFPRPYPDRPLRVSYAEVGKPDGYPVMIFLGVGCVRYLIALYDRLAAAYGLRLICVDRWGYGKTDQVEQVDRGLVEWSAVIGQVVKKLDIEKCQIIGHSAGAPYAMAVARRYPDLVRGRVHLLAPWVGQDHEAVSKWLKWVPSGVVRTATAADHKLQTYFLGKAPRLQFAPVSFKDKDIHPVSSDVSLHTRSSSVEELDESSKPPSLMRRASAVFGSSGSNSRPRSLSIYGTAASVSTVNLSLPLADTTTPISRSMRRAVSAGTPSIPTIEDSPGPMGRSPGLKNLKNIAARRSIRTVSAGPPSSDSRGTSSSAPSSDMLATPEQSRVAISASEVDFGLAEGFGSLATDLGLAMPSPTSIMSKVRSTQSLRMASESSASMSRSNSGTSEFRSLPEIPEIIPQVTIPSTPKPSSPAPPTPKSASTKTTGDPSIPFSPFPSDPIFSMALSQASHAECEPGTTSDILRIILNRPHRPWGFRYEDVAAPTHIWLGGEDKLISPNSIKWMQEVCGSTVTLKPGEGHNLLSSAGTICDLFGMISVEARKGVKDEEKAEKVKEEKRVKEREEALRLESLQRIRGGWTK